MTTFLVLSGGYVVLGVALALSKGVPLPTSGDAPWLDRLVPWFEAQNPTFGGSVIAAVLYGPLLLIFLPWMFWGAVAGMASLVVVGGVATVIAVRSIRDSTYTLDDLTAGIEWDALSPRTGRLVISGTVAALAVWLVVTMV